MNTIESKVMEMNWETGRLEEVKQCFFPEVGMRIYGEYGYGFSGSGIFAVVSVSEDGRTFEIVEIGGDHRKMRRETLHVKPISKMFGIGTYFDDEEPEFRFSESEIEEALKAHEVQEEENRRAEEEQKRKDEETRQNLIKEYSYLERIDIFEGDYRAKYRAMKENMKKVLARKFPNVKFSIHQSHGDNSAYDIDWNDGPKYDDVEKVADMFQHSHADRESGDYWDYDPSIFNTLFGGFSFVFSNRRYTEEGYSKAREVYDSEHNWADGTDEREIESRFNRWLSDYDFTIAVEEKKVNEDAVSEGVQIVDYSEKAIAIIGDTRPIREILKAHGCKFNKFLKCGCGWIASKARQAEIALALASNNIQFAVN